LPAVPCMIGKVPWFAIPPITLLITSVRSTWLEGDARFQVRSSRCTDRPTIPFSWVPTCKSFVTYVKAFAPQGRKGTHGCRDSRNHHRHFLLLAGMVVHQQRRIGRTALAPAPVHQIHPGRRGPVRSELEKGRLTVQPGHAHLAHSLLEFMEQNIQFMCLSHGRQIP
jgi:hypothetical protein